jgi:hypothetical protein
MSWDEGVTQEKTLTLNNAGCGTRTHEDGNSNLGAGCYTLAEKREAKTCQEQHSLKR